MEDGFTLLRPALHALPPEWTHALGLKALRLGILPPTPAFAHPSLKINLWGREFSNPIGLAAGFDKNAVAVDALLNQGFGFVEAGTVTPRAQAGNPKPRLFRLSEDKAVINRLGFNNKGLDVFTAHLSSRNSAGIVGANIGKNKDSQDTLADYTQCLKAVYPHADYVTVNISSPNTPGLRTLQKQEVLTRLLSALKEEHERCGALHGRRVPLLLKIAPDLEAQEMEDIAVAAVAFAIDGLVISNTTVARPASLKSRYAKEQGGLSGSPLFAPSTAVLKTMYRLTAGRIPLIGVGGVSSAGDAYAKIRAGATLVQLYTALVYQGFGVVRRIQEGLAALLARDGFSSAAQAVGKDAA